MAAVVIRRPLATRVQQGQIPNVVPTLSTKAHGSTSASKRARSPDMRPPQAPAGEAQASKRVKCSTGMTTISREHDARERERKRALKEAAKEDFRAKYTKAFPSWVFYFDTNESEAEELAGRVKQLNAVCVNTSAKTHVVDVLVHFRSASGPVFLQRSYASDNEQTCATSRSRRQQGK